MQGYFLRSTSNLGSQVNTFQNKISFSEFARFYQDKFGKQFKILLDMKCRDTTPQVYKAGGRGRDVGRQESRRKRDEGGKRKGVQRVKRERREGQRDEQELR
jgi:hypothetical protein